MPGGLDLQNLFGRPPTLIDKESDDHDAAVSVAIDAAKTTARLSMQSSSLDQLPQQLIRFLRSEGRNLTTLVLTCNALMAAPPLEYVPSLVTMDLSHNKMSELPPTLGLLTALERISLQNNRLAALPDAITRLTGLQHLDVQVSPNSIFVILYMPAAPLLPRSPTESCLLP